MAPRSSRPKLVVIIGPTASGKTELAIMIAQEFDGEIIAADSRTIYKDMDVGTAKPSQIEQKLVKHWGLDLIEPGQSYSAAKFQRYAKAKIEEIIKRGKLPILVGGTGLYVDSVVFDFAFRQAANPSLRAKLEQMSVEELHYIISEAGYKLPENRSNKRYLIRTIEAAGQVARRSDEPLAGSLIIGLNPTNWRLKRRINSRAAAKLELIIKETRKLRKTYGEEKLRRSAGIPYLATLEFLDGRINQGELLDQIQSAEWQYARRQRTWFKRNPYIQWFISAKAAFAAIKSGRIRL